MKAIVLKGVNDLVVEEVPDPRPQGDEVLVEIIQCGLCGTDVHMWSGKNLEGTFPFIPGHEWVGCVLAIGKDVKTLKVGDRVIGEPFIGCRKCDVCRNGGYPAYCPNHRYYGFTWETPGGLAQYHCSPEERLYKVPDTVTDDSAALAEAISCSHYAIWGRAGGVAPHDRVGIFGAGPIGIFAMQISLISGAQVIVVEPQTFRQDMARDMGAETIIDPSSQDVVKEVMDLTNGLGLTRIIECSGNPEAIATTLKVVAVGGMINLTGQSIGTKVHMEIGEMIWKHATIVAAAGAPYDYPNTLTLLSKGLADFDKVITHRFSLDDALEAFTLGDQGTQCGKIMMYPEASQIPAR